MAHKAHVKEAMFATNSKDSSWETQIMAVHVRCNAMVHHREHMTGMFWILLNILWFFAADELVKMQELDDSFQSWLDVAEWKRA